MLFLIETLSYGVKLGALRIKLSFDSYFSIDVIGRSGGLVVLWKTEIKGCRKLSWDLLRNLASLHSLPWVYIGDYNDLLSVDDKKWRTDHPQWLYTRHSFIGLSVYLARGRGTMNYVEERLDRAMVNSGWHERFAGASLQNLVTPVFDHILILLSTEASVHRSNHRGFKFENKWLYEQSFPGVVETCWTGFGDLYFLKHFEATAEPLDNWGRAADSKF
ncbi:hypothetical protein ACS0TY_010738 [Phlomoides rotata]